MPGRWGAVWRFVWRIISVSASKLGNILFTMVLRSIVEALWVRRGESSDTRADEPSDNRIPCTPSDSDSDSDLARLGTNYAPHYAAGAQHDLVEFRVERVSCVRYPAHDPHRGANTTLGHSAGPGESVVAWDCTRQTLALAPIHSAGAGWVQTEQFPAPGTRAATYVTSDSPNSDDPHNLPQRGVRPSTWDQRPASTQAAAKRPTATPSPAQRTQDSKRSRHKYRGRDEYYHLYTSHGVDPLDEPTKCSQAPQPEDLFVHDCMPNGVQVWIWQDDRWVTIRTWTKHPRIPRLYLELKHGDNPKWLCASTIETHARKLARKRD